MSDATQVSTTCGSGWFKLTDARPDRHQIVPRSHTESISQVQPPVTAGGTDICREACWRSTGEPLTDEELEMIDESDAYEEIFEQAIGI